MHRHYLLFLTLCVTLLFFVSGIKHMFSLQSSTKFLEKYQPFSFLPKEFDFLVELVASLIEIIAPIFMVLAVLNSSYKKHGKMAASLLALFVVSTILFIHNPFFKGEQTNFLKSLAYLGGILLIQQQL